MASPCVNGTKFTFSKWLHIISMRSPNAARPLHSVRSLHTARLLQRPQQDGDGSHKFDESMLQYLVCPLSKQPLRYDKERNELVSEAIGVAYPIVNGIPNLVPQDGRQLHPETKVNQADKDT